MVSIPLHTPPHACTIRISLCIKGIISKAHFLACHFGFWSLPNNNYVLLTSLQWKSRVRVATRCQMKMFTLRLKKKDAHPSLKVCTTFSKTLIFFLIQYTTLPEITHKGRCISCLSIDIKNVGFSWVYYRLLGFSNWSLFCCFDQRLQTYTTYPHSDIGTIR